MTDNPDILQRYRRPSRPQHTADMVADVKQWIEEGHLQITQVRIKTSDRMDMMSPRELRDLTLERRRIIHVTIEGELDG